VNVSTKRQSIDQSDAGEKIIVETRISSRKIDWYEKLMMAEKEFVLFDLYAVIKRDRKESKF